MDENKSCGNCKYFKDEDVNGEGFCEVKYEFEGCSHECDNHEFRNNGWTKITSSKISEIDALNPNRVVISWLDSLNRMQSVMLVDCSMAITTMAKFGGYYYYVLTELKLEERL